MTASSGLKTTTPKHTTLSQEDFIENYISPLLNNLESILGTHGSQNILGVEMLDGRPVDSVEDAESSNGWTVSDVPPVEGQDLSILEEAQKLVYGERGEDYGHPLDDYTRTAEMISAVLGVPVSYQQAILIMILVKISRQVNSPKRDNLVDIAGYALCLDRAIRKDEERNGPDYWDDIPF